MATNGVSSVRSGNRNAKDFPQRPALVAAIEDEVDVEILKKTCANKKLSKTNEPAHMKDSLLGNYIEQLYEKISNHRKDSTLGDDSKYKLIGKLIDDVGHAREASRRILAEHQDSKDEEYRALKKKIKQDKAAATKVTSEAKKSAKAVAKPETKGVIAHAGGVDNKSRENKLAQSNEPVYFSDDNSETKRHDLGKAHNSHVEEGNDNKKPINFKKGGQVAKPKVKEKVEMEGLAGGHDFVVEDNGTSWYVTKKRRLKKNQNAKTAVSEVNNKSEDDQPSKKQKGNFK